MIWRLLFIGLNIFLVGAFFFSDEDYSDLALGFLIYINIVMYGWYKKSSGSEIDFLEPFYTVIILFSLYAWTAGFAVVYGNGEFLSIMPTYYACMVLGVIGFMLGYQYIHIRKQKFFNSLNFIIPRIDFRSYYRTLVFFTIILVAINYTKLIALFDIAAIQSYTEAAAASRIGLTAFDSILSYLYDLSIILVLAVLLIKSFHKKRLSIIGVIIFLLYAIIGMKSGGKSLVISFFTVFLIFYNYNVKRLKLTPLVIVGVLLLIFSTLINHVRYTTSIIEMAHASIYNVSDDWLYLTPLFNGELTGPPRGLMQVISAIESGWMEYSFGSTYLNDLQSFIPRIFYPNRPLPLPERYMEIFNPGALALGLGEGNFMVTEGYWAFGLIGVFIGMFAFGAIVSIFYETIKRNLDNGVIVFVYSLAYFSLVTTAIRTGLMGSIKGTAMIVVPFIIIYYVSKLFAPAATDPDTAAGG